jgi:hypothetical protein
MVFKSVTLGRVYGVLRSDRGLIEYMFIRWYLLC